MSDTVFPSFLSISEDIPTQMGVINENTKLRLGIVKNIIYPNQKESVTKRFVEYDVLVLEQNIHGGITTVLYKNLLAAEGFGGIADFACYTYRPQKNIKNQRKTRGLVASGQDGAVVLVLFADGMANKGIIIGALGHPDRPHKHDPNKHELVFSFNGITFHIKDDGSLEASFVGKTKPDGTPENKDLGKTVLLIDKDGGFSISHKNAQLIIAKDGSFTVKNKNTTEISSEKSITYNTKDTLAINAEKTITQKTKQDLILEASGSSSIKANKVNINGSGGVNISGSKVEIKGSSSVNVQASQIVLNGTVYLGGQGGTPAVTQQTRFLGLVLNSIPVISQAIGPFSSKVFVSS